MVEERGFLNLNNAKQVDKGSKNPSPFALEGKGKEGKGKEGKGGMSTD